MAPISDIRGPDADFFVLGSAKLQEACHRTDMAQLLGCVRWDGKSLQTRAPNWSTSIYRRTIRGRRYNTPTRYTRPLFARD